MPPPDVLSVAGTPVDLVATNTTIEHLTAFARGGYPELGFSRLLRTPGALPDPWHLQPCTLTVLSTLVFSGWVSGYVDRYDERLGWERQYRALGLAYWAGNYVPVTDAMTFADTSTWDQPGDDPAQVPSRAGQTVGQVVGAILTMAANAQGLAGYGINYASLSPPTLPAATLADLATLSILPTTVVRVAGERILPALEGFVQQWHPNHFLHVQPDGTIRFLDPRTFPATTLTLNDPADPRWGLPMLTRDATDNYSRVVVRGNTLVQAFTLQDQPWAGSTDPDGGLAEDFAHDGLTNAQAKAAWHATDWSQPWTNGAPVDVGTCTCIDTLYVTINTTHTFAADQLGQGPGQLLGWINLRADSLGGLVQQYWLARIVSNTATSGGQCTVLLDSALPSLAYRSYQLFGEAAGANVVGRRYRVTNPAIAQALQMSFPYPVPYIFANGTSAEMTSAPVGTVFYNATGGGPPYTSSTGSLTIDPEGGLIYFDKPVQVIVGGLMDPPRWPAVVQALLAVAVGTLEAVAPASGDAGTLWTVEGRSRTKTITVLEWRDAANSASMRKFASELLDAVKDVVVEGSLPYFGLPGVTYLAPGHCVSIAGHDFATGWESIALPVVAAQVAFQNGPTGTSYMTTLQLSNRRTPYDASNFLRPSLPTTLHLGGAGVFGAGVAESVEASARLQEQARAETLAATRAPTGWTGRVLGPGAAAQAGLGAATFAAAGLAAAGGAAAGGLAGAAATTFAAAGGPLRQYTPQEQAAQLRVEETWRQEQLDRRDRQDQFWDRHEQEVARMEAGVRRLHDREPQAPAPRPRPD